MNDWLGVGCFGLGSGYFVRSILGGLQVGEFAFLLSFQGVAAELVSELLSGEGFDNVTCLDVLVAGEIDTALDA